MRPTLRPTRGWILPTLATLAGVGLIVVNVVASASHGMGRWQVPIWADSIGIVYYGAMAMAVFLLPAAIVLTLSPILFTRREPGSLLALKGRGWVSSTIWTLIYLGPLGLCLGLIAIGFQAGGWAGSPGGAILLWALLNARAIWLGCKPEPQPLP